MINPFPTDPVIFNFYLARFEHIAGVVILAFWACVLATEIVRWWHDRNYKNLTVALITMVAIIFGAWYLVDPLIPPSEKTVHKSGTRLGYVYTCQKSPKCKDCAANGVCTPCSANSGCLDAVDKYYDRCFDNFYDRWGIIPRHDFYKLVDDCIDERSGHKYFENTLTKPPVSNGPKEQ